MSIYPGITVRPIQDDDMQFLCDLYGTVRLEELQVVSWTMEQKLAFIQSQFDAQHAYYSNRDNYPNPNLDVIVLDGKNIGRMYVQRWPDDIRLMEITLLPEYRNRGIGTALVRQLMEESRQKKVRVSLYVENFNPAYRLYERFGFRPNGTNGVYSFMEWFPENELTTN